MQNDSGSGDVNTDFIHETAYYLLDGDGKILSCNDDSESLLGYTIEEIEGHHYTQFLSIGGIYNEAIADLIGLATRLKKVSKEVQVAKKSGEIFVAEVILQSLSGRNKENRIYTLTIAPRLINNLTSDKFINDQQLLGIFLKYSEEVLFCIDRDRSIIAFNEAANRKALKYFNKAVQKGMSILEFVSADRQEAVIKMSINVLEGKYQEAELMHEDANGIKEYYKSHLSPVFNEKGEVEYAFLVQKNITEYVTALAQVEYERSNLSALINNTRDLMWSVDTKGAIMIANKAFEEKVKLVTGFTTIAKDNPGAGISAVNLATWQAHYERAFGGEMFTIIDHTVFPKEEWVEVSFKPVKKENLLLGVACYARDITLKKKYELAQKAELRRFGELFRFAPISICIFTGEDLVFEMANPIFLDTIGQTNVNGKKLMDVMPEMEGQGIVTLLKNVYTTGESYSGKEVLFQVDVTGNGEFEDIYSTFIYQPFRGVDGEIEGVFVISMDVTEAVKSRKKIEERELYFRSLVEQAGDVILLIDDKEYIKYANPGLAKIIGYSIDEIIGQHMNFMIVGENHEETLAKLRYIHEHPGIPIPRTNCFKHKDGHLIWVEGTVTNLLHDNVVNGLVGNFIDITARKQAEEKLLNLNRLYALISGINQTIVHAANKELVFKEACRIAIETGGFLMAWIGLLDLVHSKINLIESCGVLPEEIPLFSNLYYSKPGPQFHVVNTKTSYIANAINEFDGTDAWRAYAQKRKIKSCMVLPIFKGGNLIGTYNLYSSVEDLFDESEILLLEEIAGDISFALDVFERDETSRIMSVSLAQSEKRLKQAQGIAHIGSWELDNITGLTTISEEFCRIYGLDSGIIQSKYEDLQGFIHPDDKEFVINAFRLRYETQITVPLSFRIIRKDGSIRHVLTQSEIELNDAGEVIKTYGVIHDVTQAKLAEIALKQSEANLRLIVDMLPQAICARDADGKILFVNKVFSELYGIAADQLVGKSLIDIYPDKEGALLMNAQDKEVIESNEVKYYPDVLFKDVTGKTRTFIVAKLPFNAAHSNSRAMLALSTDVTEFKKAEEERIKIVNELITRNKDLEQFSYIISHNLRAPVANIIGLTDVMQFIGVQESDKMNLLSQLNTSVIRLDNVIKDLNNVLQVKTNVSGIREQVRFSSLLKDIHYSINTQLEEHDIVLEGNFNEVDELFTLKGYLYSVFYNLITNSIKYRRDAVKTIIFVSSHLVDNSIVLSFKDNGMGMDLVKKGEQIFGLYKRFHFHTEGKGLGLFMVKTYVEALGGRISVKSDVDKGSEFIIKFDQKI